MTAPTPSALTKRELDRRGWPWAQGEHWQAMGDPGARAARRALLWCRAKILGLASLCHDPSLAVTQALDELATEIASELPPEQTGPPGVRRDLFGCGDLLVLDGEPGSLLIQATSRDNVSSRVRKICGLESARAWLLAANRLEVWGWGLVADDPQRALIRGARKPRQTMAVRVVRVRLADFAPQRAAEGS